LLDFTIQFKDSINKRISIHQILDGVLKHEYKELNTGNFIRINPSPISGKNNNSFSIGFLSSGLEFYTLWSSSSDFDEFKSLPEKGTAADIIACICKDYEEVHQLIRGTGFLKLTPKTNIEFETHINRDELSDIYSETLEKMTFQKLKYYKEIRKFDNKTIAHFKIGFYRPIKIEEKWFNYYSFPYMDINGVLQHIKYKIIENNAPKEYKTSQIKNNSGGDYLFNESDLNKKIVIICEGEHDVMRIWEKFTHNKNDIGVVGLGGNPSFKKIKKFKEANKKYILAFDNDEQGEKYTEKFKLVFPESKIITGIGKDPDEWFLNNAFEIKERYE